MNACKAKYYKIQEEKAKIADKAYTITRGKRPILLPHCTREQDELLMKEVSKKKGPKGGWFAISKHFDRYSVNACVSRYRRLQRRGGTSIKWYLYPTQPVYVP